MADFDDEHAELLILYFADDAVVANPVTSVATQSMTFEGNPKFAQIFVRG